MSQADLDKAKERLEQSKQGVPWMLAILNNPDATLQEYELSPEERQQFVREHLQDMTGLLLSLAQELAKQAESPVESTTLLQLGVLQPWQFQVDEIVKPGHIIRAELRPNPEEIILEGGHPEH